MKRFGSFVLVALMLVGVSSFAQRGQRLGAENGQMYGYFGRYNCRVPNLTEEQQQKIDDLRVKHIKEVTPLRNELGEKRAKMRTLQSADKPDLNAINAVIDDMSALRTQIQKKAAAHRAEVSSLLTDEQKVYFNSRQGRNFNKGMNRGGNRGMGRGRGYGFYGNGFQD